MVAEAVRLLSSMRDQQTKAPVPHPQAAGGLSPAAARHRGARRLGLDLSAHAGKKVAHLVIDSTGLRLYGEGESAIAVAGK